MHASAEDDLFDPASYELHLVPLASAEGQRIAGNLSDGWAIRLAALDAAYEAQAEASWCAFASGVVALRALASTGADVSVPTQQALRDLHVRTRSAQSGGGVSLAELDVLLRGIVGSSVEVHRQSGDEYDSLLASLGADLLLGESDGSVVLINLLRLLGGHWMGHWSVIGALSAHADDGSCAYALVLDVAAHKVEHHWVPLELLARCLCTRNARGESRGYLRLAPPPAAWAGGAAAAAARHFEDR